MEYAQDEQDYPRVEWSLTQQKHTSQTAWAPFPVP